MWKIKGSCAGLSNYTAWKVSLFEVTLVQMRENADQNNSNYGHFLRSASLIVSGETFLIQAP